MDKIRDDILSYREMLDLENVQTLQRGMNYRMNQGYSVILMSQRVNAPYIDRINEELMTIEYEGHDSPRTSLTHDVKRDDQPEISSYGRLTQNGLFIKAVKDFKNGDRQAELVKVYEKILSGVWSLKGLFDLIDYKVVNDGYRNVFRFILKLSDRKIDGINIREVNIEHTRLIPTEIKKEVWKRDDGKCVICGDNKNLHFDHDLPFSKGGTSLSVKNVKLLCLKHNLQKSDKIE